MHDNPEIFVIKITIGNEVRDGKRRQKTAVFHFLKSNRELDKRMNRPLELIWCRRIMFPVCFYHNIFLHRAKW